MTDLEVLQGWARGEVDMPRADVLRLALEVARRPTKKTFNSCWYCSICGYKLPHRTLP